MVIVSLNEIDASARRAARGAGMDWGLAEEAGKAVRWLAAHGLPSVTILAGLLEARQGRPLDAMKPLRLTGSWQAAEGPLCPIIAGAALSDLAGEIIRGRTIVLGPASAPLLLVAFLGPVAAAQGANFTVTWDGAEIFISPQGPIADAEPRGLEAAMVPRVAIAAAPRTGRAAVPAKLAGVAVDEAIWQRLQYWAAKTYVPASEQSRILGAGAGLSDND